MEMPSCTAYQLSGCMGTCLPGTKLVPGVAGVAAHCVMLMVWEASGICFPAPVCPISLLQVDSWALGVLLYTLVYGTMPFDGFDHKNLIRQISSGEYREPTQPSGACPGRVRGRVGVFRLPALAHAFCFCLVCVRSLLLFLFLLSMSLPPGKAGMLGCFTQTSPDEIFRTSILHSQRAKNAVSLLGELGQVPDSVWIHFLHEKLKF